jgi:hypothetical protein
MAKNGRDHLFFLVLIFCLIWNSAGCACEGVEMSAVAKKEAAPKNAVSKAIVSDCPTT